MTKQTEILEDLSTSLEKMSSVIDDMASKGQRVEVLQNEVWKSQRFLNELIVTFLRPTKK